MNPNTIPRRAGTSDPCGCMKGDHSCPHPQPRGSELDEALDNWMDTDADAADASTFAPAGPAYSRRGRALLWGCQFIFAILMIPTAVCAFDVFPNSLTFTPLFWMMVINFGISVAFGQRGSRIHYKPHSAEARGCKFCSSLCEMRERVRSTQPDVIQLCIAVALFAEGILFVPAAVCAWQRTPSSCNQISVGDHPALEIVCTSTTAAVWIIMALFIFTTREYFLVAACACLTALAGVNSVRALIMQGSPDSIVFGHNTLVANTILGVSTAVFAIATLIFGSMLLRRRSQAKTFARSLIAPDRQRYDVAWANHLTVPGEKEALTELGTGSEWKWIYVLKEEPLNVGSRLSELYCQADRVNGWFQSKVESWHRELLSGGEQVDPFHATPVKTVYRGFEKIMRSYQGRVNRLSDIVRASIVCHSARGVLSLLRLIRRDPGVKVLRCKNRFRLNSSAAESGGYRDLQLVLVTQGFTPEWAGPELAGNLQFVARCGMHCAEMQIHLKPLHDVKVCAEQPASDMPIGALSTRSAVPTPTQPPRQWDLCACLDVFDILRPKRGGLVYNVLRESGVWSHKRRIDEDEDDLSTWTGHQKYVKYRTIMGV